MIKPILIFLLSGFLHANDFNEQLRRIQSSGNQIDTHLGKLQSLGFATQNKDVGETQSKNKSTLIQIHSTTSVIRSEAGRVLHAQVLNRLIVGPEGSPVIVSLASDQGLFSGLKVLGQAKQGSTEGRLYIDFDRIIFRSGRVLNIKGLALDTDGGFGLKAQVLSSKALMIGGSLASSFISGYAASQQTQQTGAIGVFGGGFGFSQTQPTPRNGVLQGVAQTAADQSKRLIDDATKEKPVLIVEKETALSVYLDEEVRF